MQKGNPGNLKVERKRGSAAALCAPVLRLTGVEEGIG